MLAGCSRDIMAQPFGLAYNHVGASRSVLEEQGKQCRKELIFSQVPFIFGMHKIANCFWDALGERQ